MTVHLGNVLVALQAFGVADSVQDFVTDVVAQRALVDYGGTSATYVALHQAGAPVSMYVRRDYVDVATELNAARRLRSTTGVKVVGKATLPYVRVETAQLGHAGRRAQLLAAAVEGVDWVVQRPGKARSADAAAARGGAGEVPAAPMETCPGCFTVVAVNGQCSC